MGFIQNINQIRRNLMRRITGSIGKSHTDLNIDLSQQAEIGRILISRPNGRLGNMLLITPLVQEVIATFPDCRIDLFVKGRVADSVFRNYPNIDRIMTLPGKPFKNLASYLASWFALRKHHYDLVLNVDSHSSSGRLSTQFARAKYRFFGDAPQDTLLKYIDHQHMAKYPVYNLRSYLLGLGYPNRRNPIPLLDLKLSVEELTAGRQKLDAMIQNDKPTLALFTNATGSKCYSESWWKDFHDRLQATYPEYNIVEILPVTNVSRIGFVAPSFYSRDIREMGAVIAHVAAFVSADCGIMHLASAVGAPVVALFSSPNYNKYHPYNSRSIAIDTQLTDVQTSIGMLGDVLSETEAQYDIMHAKFTFYRKNPNLPDLLEEAL